jgi:hypothetical protein
MCIFFYGIKIIIALSVAPLTLGLRSKQGLAKVRAKIEAWESHFMLSRMWESVREWTPQCQVSSHFGS